MIISNAQVQMQSMHEYSVVKEERLSVEFWRDQSDTESQNDLISISTSAQNSIQSVDSQQRESLRKNIEFEISLLKMLVERLTGKKIEFVAVDQNVNNTVNESTLTLDNNLSQGSSDNWGLSIDYSSSVEEVESISFETSAIVNTADGKTIEVDLAFNSSRSYKQHESVSIRAGQALKDPLVLNFSGSSLELSSQRFEFDLDVDDQIDQVPIFQSDSAYLALDKNNDGEINNGSELFGALTGDGFHELSKYDEDNNGWIDEADTVFTDLKLFTPGVDGRGQLITLTEKGVGAIHLGNIITPFQLVDVESNNLSGQIRSSGLYLMESGSSGTIQQIDLAV